MALFGRREDPKDNEPDDEPIDDAVDFDVSLRQKRIRENGAVHTKRQMAKVWAAIMAGWQSDRNRMRFFNERTGKIE